MLEGTLMVFLEGMVLRVCIILAVAMEAEGVVLGLTMLLLV